jgi:hypothetical protein
VRLIAQDSRTLRAASDLAAEKRLEVMSGVCVAAALLVRLSERGLVAHTSCGFDTTQVLETLSQMF